MCTSSKSLLDLIKYPILTEKTSRLIEQNQYSFAVDRKADKISIKSAVEPFLQNDELGGREILVCAWVGS